MKRTLYIYTCRDQRVMRDKLVGKRLWWQHTLCDTERRWRLQRPHDNFAFLCPLLMGSHLSGTKGEQIIWGAGAWCSNKSLSVSGSQGLNLQLSLENMQQIWYWVTEGWQKILQNLIQNIHEYFNILIPCPQLFLQVKNCCLKHRMKRH